MTDYIRREAAVRAIDVQNIYHGIIAPLQEILCDIPAADVAPVVHGRWVMTEFVSEDTGIWWSWYCSNCGNKYIGLGKLDVLKYKYCPTCGAKMDGGKKDEVD